MPLENISQILLILSGKGGVGKSSVTLQLALSLSLAGHNVGILDIDLTGPSIPRLLGLENAKITQAPGGWLPVSVHPSSDGSSDTPKRGSLHALSLAFLLPSRDSAVIWRGPKKTAMIRQFVSDVMWPDLDYLLIDTPPGTSDEHIAIVEELHKLAPPTSISGSTTIPGSMPNGHLTQKLPPRLSGAVLVTTPQAISTSDVRKEINFCVKTSVPVLGVVENMSGYMCPCCGEVTNLFSKGGGRVMAEEMGVRFLGEVPVDQTWGEVVEGKGDEAQDDTGEATNGAVQRPMELLVERYRGGALSKIFEGFAREIDASVRNTP
jgi:Mrp family chromosome partitioning ATPase